MVTGSCFCSPLPISKNQAYFCHSPRKPLDILDTSVTSNNRSAPRRAVKGSDNSYHEVNLKVESRLPVVDFHLVVYNTTDIPVQNVGVIIPRRRLVLLSLFFSLSTMNFEAPVSAEESEFALDESVKRALDAAKLGRSESAARIGQVFFVCRDVAQQCFLPVR